MWRLRDLKSVLPRKLFFWRNEMGFYEMLVDYYDEIFPPSELTLEFLGKGLEDSAKILDAACGTGTYTIGLAQEGYQTVGVDLDETMIALAEKKAGDLGLDVDFIVSDMQNIDLVSTSDLDRIFCIGNSLVHLKNREEIKSFIETAYALLKDQGDLIIQIINYDRILDEGITFLPTIEVRDKGITFVRTYRYVESTGLIEFRTRLRVNGEETESCVSLYPIRKEDLYQVLVECGFTEVRVFGGFDESPYSKDALPLVLKAKKTVAE